MAVPLDYAPQPGARKAIPLAWILATIYVIGVLFGVCAAPRNVHTPARRGTAESDVSAIGLGLDAFKDDVGRYPTAGEGLGVLVTPPASAANWNGPYLKRRTLLDPWGRPYLYTTTKRFLQQ